MLSEKGDFILLNYIIYGVEGVGKTSIINQYCIRSWKKKNKICESKNKMFDGVNFKIQFWEEGSVCQTRWQNQNPYELVNAMFIVIDLCDKNSIAHIYNYYWRHKLIRYIEMGPIVIVANKCDSHQRQDIIIIYKVITKSQLRGIQNQLDIQYFEVTAKSHLIINTMFETIFLQCVGFYIKQGNIKQLSLSQYYQEQNNGLQVNILEYQKQSKLHFVINIFLMLLSILCVNILLSQLYNINNIQDPSIEGSMYGLFIFSVILTITISNMRGII